MEMMITVAILGVVVTVSAPLFLQSTNFWRLTSARYAIQRDVRAALDLINRYTRQAKSSTVVISRQSGQPPYSSMSFTMTDQHGVDQAVTFYQQGNGLYMTVAGKTTRLSSSLAYIAFTYPRTDDISIISVAMTMQSPTYKGGKKALQLSIQKVRIMN